MQVQQLLTIALIIGVFYFLVIRPQQKRSAAQRKMLAAMKPGDEIVTIGGIFAVVVEVGDRVRVRIADGSELELSKQAIAQVVPPKVETDGDPADVEPQDSVDEEDEAQPAEDEAEGH